MAPHTGDPELRQVTAPPEIGAMTYRMIWHPRLDGDPAQNWLRTAVRSVTAALPGVPVSRGSGR
ncbi:hypothetical protein AB0C59_15640 [Streptomyces sp. NPDC048664]|uniref:hypothetical protein n=1 Tax=Streptomyces sp. NPDC048664 TaxID=3154505 RepID=UPI0034423FA8